MIIIPSQRNVLITPSRTASRAVHLAVCTTPYLDAIWVDGPVGWDVISHDHRHVPMWFQGFDVSMVIRHPLDRLVSLWRHIVEHDPPLPNVCTNFSDYVDRVAHARKEYYGPFRWTLTDWAEGHELAAVVRYETLENDLSDWCGVRLTLPIIGKTNRKKWPEYYDQETESIAREWACDDFDRWYS